MRADAEQFGNPLGGAGGVQHHGTRHGFSQPLGEIAKQRGRSFYAHQINNREPGAGGRCRSTISVVLMNSSTPWPAASRSRSSPSS